MASTYSNLGIELIGTGDQSGTWGVTTNNNLGTALEEAIVGTVNQAVTAVDLTLPWSTASNATQVARHLRLNLTGSSGGASNLIVPTLASGKNYIIKNSSTTAITVKTAAGTGILVPAGESRSLYQDGTDVVVSDSYHSGTFTGTFIGAGQFTTLSASGAVTGVGITARFASPGPIGNTLADTGAFTTLTASGNVGIGTISPDATLTVNGAASFAAGTALLPSIARAGDLNTGIFFPAADTIAFSGGGAESVRITSNGFVSIGTTTNYTFDQIEGARTLIVQSSDASTTIAGSTNAVVICNSDTTTNNTSQLNFAAITGASANQYTAAVISCIFGARTNGQYPTGILTFSTSTTTNTAPSEKMRIANNGIVTMSAYGAGAATFSTAGVISSVSDETWKIKDGVPVDPDSMLKKLEPGYWYYNDEKKETFGVDRQLGFYAQNVNSAIGPEAAPTPEEGKPWGYYDRSVLAVTVMSLQKALATIESLTARVSALEGNTP